MIPEAPALVIGGGPAGLMAAEMLLRAGIKVILAEAKPSVGRKFLMAGKSGLNLTRDETLDRFIATYEGAAPWLAPSLRDFGPAEVQHWARELGQEVFTGSTGRVFPVVMKASPLLRAWLHRLGDLGLDLRARWRWTGFDGAALRFDTPTGPQVLEACCVVLALGGASWQRLGSDGAWVAPLRALGIDIAPFEPANAGVAVRWSQHLQPFFGQPVKAVALSAGGRISRGEFVVTAKGLEGGGLYPLSPALRQRAALTLDLFPDRSLDALTERVRALPVKDSIGNRLRKLGLQGPKLALSLELGRPLPAEGAALARLLKALPVPHDGLRPLDEAISSAGGIRRSAVDDDLMLQAWPGVFVAGEMLDWEAPTGGYLLTACLATGRLAGLAAARWSRQNAGHDPARG